MRSLFVITALLFVAACGQEGNFNIPTAALPASPSNTPSVPLETATPQDTPPAQTVAPIATMNIQALPTSTSMALRTAMIPVRLPDAAAYTWKPFVNGLKKPTGLANADDGSGRLFIIEQSGTIRIIQENTLLPIPFLDITARVGASGFEQGLLGLAFHPNYKKNGDFFVNYTDFNGNTVIARFQVSDNDPNRADPGREKILLRVAQPYPNHNGGMVTFGPDGYLYLGLGDGGSGGDPHGNGQSLSSLLGKILRIDVDHGDPYAIPGDNPYTEGRGQPEIWAYGLRNPWRFSFDHLTGDLYIGDVGQNLWEEIDFLPAGSLGGANFGWNFFEGTHTYQATAPEGLSIVAPIFEYSHDMGCSVTGGVVYRGALLPEWQGVYLYGDYCTGRVWGARRIAQGDWLNALLFEGIGQITSFGEDEAGEVYLADQAGIIYTLTGK